MVDGCHSSTCFKIDFPSEAFPKQHSCSKYAAAAQILVTNRLYQRHISNKLISLLVTEICAAKTYLKQVSCLGYISLFLSHVDTSSGVVQCMNVISSIALKSNFWTHFFVNSMLCTYTLGSYWLQIQVAITFDRFNGISIFKMFWKSILLAFW